MNAEIKGRRATLHPVTDAHFGFVYALATSPELTHRWIYRGYTPSPEELAANLRRDVWEMYVVERNETHEFTGLVLAYNADLHNGIVKVATVATPDYLETGRLMGPTALLINRLFESGCFRKVYLESVGYNYATFRSGEGEYWVEEAVLKDHEYYAGRRWDVHILAVDRDRWAQVWDRLGRLVLPQQVPSLYAS